MNKIDKTFNELIQHKVAPYFGEVLLDCKLISTKYRFDDYRYDLLFIFEKEYNNPRIQLESVLSTCDDLFDWVDLRDLPNLSIVIMNKFGRNQHYSYFELMDETLSYKFVRGAHNHPKYKEYLQWKEYQKLKEEREKKRKSFYQEQMELITRNDLTQQARITESRKKKFLFW